MGRWEPNARGRLARAALKLYAEQGFERTTVTEIAEAAGLTERTFFRHFADKREVLFYGTEMALGVLTRSIGEAPAAMSAMDAVGAALESLGTVLQENPERVRRRDAVVSAHTELRERELVKLEAFASAMSGALRERGTPALVADLAAEAGIAAFKVAYARWVAAEPGGAGDAGGAGGAAGSVGAVGSAGAGGAAGAPGVGGARGVGGGADVDGVGGGVDASGGPGGPDARGMGERGLPQLFRESLDELRKILADRGPA